jgi:phosphatidylserine/phosphatidylglycerophosphate/cardiolipin synthase-like enzyme
VNTLVVTTPPGLLKSMAGLKATHTAFSEIVGSARHDLKIIAPYVDPSFTSLVAGLTVPVRVLTTPAPGRPPRGNPVLERCSQISNLVVRYLNERRDKTVMFQMHAKLIMADDRLAYVGSANMTDTSLHYNLELGLIVQDESSCAALARFFGAVWECGVAASEL